LFFKVSDIDMFEHFIEAVYQILDIHILIVLLGGVFLGISIGALPGLTAVMGVAILVTLTYGMDPLAGILMLLGIFQGAMYGGSISAILIRTPGTPSAAATLFDGYPLTIKGESGRAIAVATISSFTGGQISVLIMAVASPLVAGFALRFSAEEYFALGIFGLTLVASLSGRSILKGCISALLGLYLALVGVAPMVSFPRYTFGVIDLQGGVTYIPALIGIFALSEVATRVEKLSYQTFAKQRISKILPRWKDILRIKWVLLRSSIIGSVIGAIPGTGADIAAFVSYNETKRFSRTPELFGTGMIEGVAAAESANNAATAGTMIPLLTLGIPGGAVAAILIGAFMIHGMQPGPLLFQNNPVMVYGLMVGMFAGNFFMLALGLLAIRFFVKIISTPQHILLPAIVVLCVVGSYALRNASFDIWLMMAFGALGYIMNKLGIPLVPLVLGRILGPIIEENFARAMLMNDMNILPFFTRPICAVLWIFILLSLFNQPMVQGFRRWRSGRKKKP